MAQEPRIHARAERLSGSEVRRLCRFTVGMYFLALAVKWLRAGQFFSYFLYFFFSGGFGGAAFPENSNVLRLRNVKDCPVSPASRIPIPIPIPIRMLMLMLMTVFVLDF